MKEFILGAIFLDTKDLLLKARGVEMEFGLLTIAILKLILMKVNT
jgi:hypothetical protein